MRVQGTGDASVAQFGRASPCQGECREFKSLHSLRAVSSVGRALPRHGRGHWFKSSTAHHLPSLIFLGILPLSPVFQKPVLHFLLALLEQDLVSEMLAAIEDQEGHQSR